MELGVVGELDGGRVLAGDHGTRVDRLALTEHERILLAAGLSGSQPLEATGRRAGGVDDGENDPEGEEGGLELKLTVRGNDSHSSLVCVGS